MLEGADRVVALTGAGISVPSGIPDFRTPGSGIWENVDPFEVATIDAFRRDPRRFWSFYRPRFAALGDKLPNPAHQALVELEGAAYARRRDHSERRPPPPQGRKLARDRGPRVDRDLELHVVRLDLGARGRRGACSTTTASRSARRASATSSPTSCCSARCSRRRRWPRPTLSPKAPTSCCASAPRSRSSPWPRCPSSRSTSGGELAIVTKGPTPYDDDAAVKLDADVVEDLTAVLAALDSTDR